MRCPPGRARLLAALVLGIAAVALLAAAPALAFTHPYQGSDVTQCWQSGCHATQFSQWSASTPYTSAAYGELKGHNVTMPQSLTNAAHNSDELLINDCIDCHSPFSARHMDGTTPTKISELVTPADQTGSPAGTWSLTPPYATAVAASDPAGFWLPAATSAPAPTQAAWEGISCRVCHNVNKLDPTTGLPTLAFFNSGPAVNATASPYAYTAVPTLANGQSDTTWLCNQCHQPNSDDTREPLSVSVHAGLACTDCHGANPNGSGGFNHNLSAGQKGAAIDQTSCNRCHGGKNAVNSGHPDVTRLATSLMDHAKYIADPAGNLQVDAAKWHNVHFITCDTCHQPTGMRSSYSVVYGSSLTISGKRSTKKLPVTADDGSVKLWTIPVMTDSGPVGGSQLVSTSSGAPGASFALKGYRPTANTTLFVTQALPLTPDTATTVITVPFPGLGRGVQVKVVVKVRATLAASAKRVRHGKTVMMTTTLAPDKAGKQITLQSSRDHRKWTKLRVLTLGTASSAKHVWKAPAAKGKYYFRAVYAGDKANAGNSSAIKTVVVF
jgi:nitrate reductase cytochrome c-type subunit